MRPPSPRIRIGASSSVALKPVPRTSTSAGCSAPSAVRMPSGVTSAIGSSTSRTFGRPRAGSQRLVNSTRLQPSSWSGASRRRSAGSGTWCRSHSRHTDSIPRASGRDRVSATPKPSVTAKYARRNPFCSTGNRVVSRRPNRL